MAATLNGYQFTLKCPRALYLDLYCFCCIFNDLRDVVSHSELSVFADDVVLFKKTC